MREKIRIKCKSARGRVRSEMTTVMTVPFGFAVWINLGLAMDSIMPLLRSIMPSVEVVQH